MVKAFSEQLAEMSARAKAVEDSFAAAKEESSAKLHEREEHVKADMAKREALRKQRAAEAKDNVSTAWTAMATQVQSDVNSLRAEIDYKKYQHDRKMASKAADDAEENADRAIQFALDAIDYAEAAVLNAVLARATADAM